MSKFYTPKSDSKATPTVGQNKEFVDNREDLHEVITDIFDEATRYRYRESIEMITDSDQIKDIDMSKQHTLIFKGADSVKNFNNNVGSLRTKSVVVFLEVPAFNERLSIKADVVMFIGCGKITPSSQRIVAKHLMVMDTEEFSLAELDIFKKVVIFAKDLISPNQNEVEEDWYVFRGMQEVIPVGSKRFNRTPKTDDGTRYMINPKEINKKITFLLNEDEAIADEDSEMSEDVVGFNMGRIMYQQVFLRNQISEALLFGRTDDLRMYQKQLADLTEDAISTTEKLKMLSRPKKEDSATDEWVNIWDFLGDYQKNSSRHRM